MHRYSRGLGTLHPYILTLETKHFLGQWRLTSSHSSERLLLAGTKLLEDEGARYIG